MLCPPEYNLKDFTPTLELDISWLCVPSIHSRHLNASRTWLYVVVHGIQPVSVTVPSSFYSINLHIHIQWGPVIFYQVLLYLFWPRVDIWHKFMALMHLWEPFLWCQIPALSHIPNLSIDIHVNWERKDQKEHSESQQPRKELPGQKSNPEMDNEKIHLRYLSRLLPSDSSSSLYVSSFVS